MPACNRLDLETVGSRLIMSKNPPRYWQGQWIHYTGHCSWAQLKLQYIQLTGSLMNCKGQTHMCPWILFPSSDLTKCWQSYKLVFGTVNWIRRRWTFDRYILDTKSRFCTVSKFTFGTKVGNLRPLLGRPCWLTGNDSTAMPLIKVAMDIPWWMCIVFRCCRDSISPVHLKNQPNPGRLYWHENHLLTQNWTWLDKFDCCRRPCLLVMHTGHNWDFLLNSGSGNFGLALCQLVKTHSITTDSSSHIPRLKCNSQLMNTVEDGNKEVIIWKAVWNNHKTSTH